MSARGRISLVLVLVLAAVTATACRDAAAPDRLILSGFDTTTWRGSLIVAPNVGWWHSLQATVTSVSGVIDPTTAGGFRFSIDKPNLLSAEDPAPAISATASSVAFQKSYLVHAIGGATGDVATMTIWHEADRGRTKKIIVTIFRP